MDNPLELDYRYEVYKQECSRCGYQFNQKPMQHKEESFIEYNITCPKCFYEDYWFV